jgi:hypothetical protein
MEDVVGRAARSALGLNTQQCTATSSSGERCGNPPIRGGFVCRFHGGNAPSVRKAAQQRLMSLIDPILDYLTRMFIERPPCEVCGRSDADRDPVILRACQLVLDRAGFGPQSSVLIATEPKAPSWTRWLTNAELAEIAVYIDRAQGRMEAGEQMTPDTPLLLVDGVVVEDGPSPTSTEPDGALNPAKVDGPATGLPDNTLQEITHDEGDHDA